MAPAPRGSPFSRAGKRWTGRRPPTSAGTTPASFRSPIARRWLGSSTGSEPVRRAVFFVSALVLLIAAPASAQLDQLLKELDTLTRPATGAPGDVKIGAALKQALQVGTENAVKLTGRTDGYFTNQAIKILMPERLRTLERGLRTVGKALDGLFHVVGEEERKIRTDPAARVTDLLKEVFGK